MTDHSELRDLATLLPLGGLSTEDERRIDEHLRAGCAECEAALREGVLVADALAEGVPRIEPSKDLRARVLARVAREPQPSAADPARAPRVGAAPRPRSRGLWLRRAAVAAALAASVVAAVGLGLEARDLRGALDLAGARITDLETRLAAGAAERTALARDLASAERIVDELTAPATRTVALAGLETLPQASARAFLDPEARRLVLIVYDLPPPPPGRDYQLWVIAGDGAPVSAGIVDVGQGARSRHEAASLPAIAGPVTIAVTIEPAGGLPQPSGPMVLAGKGI